MEIPWFLPRVAAWLLPKSAGFPVVFLPFVEASVAHTVLVGDWIQEREKDGWRSACLRAPLCAGLSLSVGG